MRKWLIIGGVVVLFLVLLGGGAFFILRARSQQQLTSTTQTIQATPTPLPRRSNASCDEFNNRVYGQEYQRDVWNKNLPAALQQLPPGATLCGKIPSIDGTFLLANSLDEQALFSFYRTQITSAGCTVRGEQDATQSVGAISQGTATPFRKALLFTCSDPKGLIQIGYVMTYNDQNAYMIVFGNPIATPGSSPKSNPTTPLGNPVP